VASSNRGLPSNVTLRTERLVSHRSSEACAPRTVVRVRLPRRAARTQAVREGFIAWESRGAQGATPRSPTACTTPACMPVAARDAFPGPRIDNNAARSGVRSGRSGQEQVKENGSSISTSVPCTGLFGTFLLVRRW
jgi:hypothetical protein